MYVNLFKNADPKDRLDFRNLCALIDDPITYEGWFEFWVLEATYGKVDDTIKRIT